MGNTQSLSQEELYSLFNDVDVNHSDTLDLSEVSKLCQLIWSKEGLSNTPLPERLAQTVFDLLDLDGDGVITRQEFELLVEEVYADRKKYAQAGEDEAQPGGLLNFLGVPGTKDPSPAVDADPSPAAAEIKKKNRKKIDEISEPGSEISEKPKTAEGLSDSESSSFSPPPRSVKSEEEVSAMEEGGWFGGISSYFQTRSSDQPTISDQKPATVPSKVDKEVEQEAAPFWRRLFESKKEPQSSDPGSKGGSPPSPVVAPVAVVPLRQFLLTQPQISVTERALRFNAPSTSIKPLRPVRPWPVDIAPLWRPPMEKW